MRNETMKKKQSEKLLPFRPRVDDVLWWDSLKPGGKFSEAAKEIRAIGKDRCEVLWPDDGSAIIVRELIPTKAVRKRTRRQS